MELTKRQKEILNSIIKVYIETAEPVSSSFLEKKYKFGICPATIRIEMQKLTEADFICQPHTSAGRVPTDKGYRFFVDSLFEKEFPKEGFDLKIEKETGDAIKFVQFVTRNLSVISSNLALGYLPQEKIFWKDGWERIIKEPEFVEKKVIDNFIGMIEEFEEEIVNFKINTEIKVYIGKENPFSKTKEFSTIVTTCRLPKSKNGVLAILGPKRMDYDKNIGSLNFLIKNLEKI